MSTNTFIKAQHNLEREEEGTAMGHSVVHRGRLHGAEQQRWEQHPTPTPSTGVVLRGSRQWGVDFVLRQ